VYRATVSFSKIRHFGDVCQACRACVKQSIQKNTRCPSWWLFKASVRTHTNSVHKLFGLERSARASGNTTRMEIQQHKTRLQF
jgi:hypothetical protein